MLSPHIDPCSFSPFECLLVFEGVSTCVRLTAHETFVGLFTTLFFVSYQHASWVPKGWHSQFPPSGLSLLPFNRESGNVHGNWCYKDTNDHSNHAWDTKLIVAISFPCPAFWVPL